MDYRCSFRCVAGCEGSYPVEDVIYRCPKCGELLEVQHDLAALKTRSAAAWIKLFDERNGSSRWPYGSGVWGKKEWVIPHIADDCIVSLNEGGSNLFWAERYGATLGLSDLWIKLCGNSHTGSFKDLGMTVLVSVVKKMVREGKPIRAIVCASTGDTSAAVAAYAAAAGIRAAVLLPRGKITTAQLVQPLANGALVCSLDTDFDGCMAIVQKLAEEQGIYLANSMNSLRLEGQKTVAIEIVQQFDWEVPDWVIIPGGNLGNVSALGAGFDLMFELGLITRRPRICVAQAEAANPLYRAYKAGWDKFEPMTAQQTEASAIRIGNPVSLRRAIRSLQRYNGVVEQASESELAEAAAAADRTGTFTCPHTGVALAALVKLVERGEIKKNERVVVISTASGLKFTDFKVRYHEGQIPGVKSAYPNQPVSLPNDYESVKRTVLQANARLARTRIAGASLAGACALAACASQPMGPFFGDEKYLVVGVDPDAEARTLAAQMEKNGFFVLRRVRGTTFTALGLGDGRDVPLKVRVVTARGIELALDPVEPTPFQTGLRYELLDAPVEGTQDADHDGFEEIFVAVRADPVEASCIQVYRARDSGFVDAVDGKKFMFADNARGLVWRELPLCELTAEPEPEMPPEAAAPADAPPAAEPPAGDKPAPGPM